MDWELSAVFIGSAIRFATPLLLGATGELVSQRAGVLNMSLEGMMPTGARRPQRSPTFEAAADAYGRRLLEPECRALQPDLRSNPVLFRR